eukprot:scaffold211649_cov34-Tisochrysis_lutea.AAC.5
MGVLVECDNESHEIRVPRVGECEDHVARVRPSSALQHECKSRHEGRVGAIAAPPATAEHTDYLACKRLLIQDLGEVEERDAPDAAPMLGLVGLWRRVGRGGEIMGLKTDSHPPHARRRRYRSSNDTGVASTHSAPLAASIVAAWLAPAEIGSNDAVERSAAVARSSAAFQSARRADGSFQGAACSGTPRASRPTCLVEPAASGRFSEEPREPLGGQAGFAQSQDIPADLPPLPPLRINQPTPS